MIIYNITSKVKRMVEVGAGDIVTSKSFLYWSDSNIEIDVFEPNPIFYIGLTINAGDKRNVRVHNLALTDFSGHSKLYLLGYNSYLVKTYSQFEHMMKGQNHLINGGRLHGVPVSTISHFDDGKIDVLYLSCNGCEWAVLNRLISRPKMIYWRHQNDTGYRPLNYQKIKQWLRINDYLLMPPLDNYQDNHTQKEFYFCRRDIVDNKEVGKVKFTTRLNCI